MTLDEAASRYNIPPDVLHDYASRLPDNQSDISDSDLEQLHLIVTLQAIGFDQAEIIRYLSCASLPQGTNSEQLRMLDEKRACTLAAIHAQEHQLAQLDVLRHHLRTAKKHPII